MTRVVRGQYVPLAAIYGPATRLTEDLLDLQHQLSIAETLLDTLRRGLENILDDKDTKEVPGLAKLAKRANDELQEALHRVAASRDRCGAATAVAYKIINLPAIAETAPAYDTGEGE